MLFRHNLKILLNVGKSLVFGIGYHVSQILLDIELVLQIELLALDHVASRLFLNIDDEFGLIFLF